VARTVGCGGTGLGGLVAWGAACGVRCDGGCPERRWYRGLDTWAFFLLLPVGFFLFLASGALKKDLSATVPLFSMADLRVLWAHVLIAQLSGFLLSAKQ